MTLEPGTQFGEYEVVGLIGQGGMGEVYRARDVRLKRTVALKIIASAFSDPGRLARFRREAELLASLNHPNIAAIYGLVDSGGSTAIALEFVEGQSLAERITRGPLPAPEAVALARQIAAAIAAAHESGIVHRDLKPANIVVRPDGTAKVLDFGVAKVVEPAIGESTETKTVAGTAIGVLVGTPAYMSPEQATGAPIDHRTDIWAFGCVLFEMLSGRRAFDGSTISDTVTAVLTRSPDWSQLPATTPPALRTLLRRCLATDPRRRPPSMDTVVFVLDEEQAFSLEPDAPKVERPAWRAWMIAAAALAAGAALATGLSWSLGREAPTTVLRTTILASASATGIERNFSFTTDGQRLLYFSEDGSQLLVRPLDALEAAPLLTTAAYLRGIYPSPDGLSLAFFENSLTLRKMPAAGGTAATILTTDGPSRGAVWLADQTIVFATSLPETGLQHVPASGGPATVLTTPDRARGELDHLAPERLPGDRALLFTITPTQGGTARLAVLDLTTRTWRTVVEGGTRGRYVDTGHLMYASAGSLWAIRFDLSRLETVGAAVEVVPRASLGAYPQFDVSSDGSLVYARGIRQLGSDLNVPTWVTRDGSETPLALAPATYRHPRISPDGRRLAIATEGGELHLLNLTQGNAQLSRLTFRDEEDWMPVWMPDGRGLVFGSRSGGGVSNLFRQYLDDSKAERLTESSDMQIPTAITADGDTVLMHVFPRDIQSVRLSGRREPVTLVDSPVVEQNIALSPDGRWIAYEGETPGRIGELNVYVRPFPDVGRRVWQITTEGGTFPTWAASGRELYYMKPNGMMATTAIEAAGDAITVGNATDLFRGRYLIRDGTHGRQYDVAADGRFLMLKYQRSTEQGHFVLVQNWTSELTRLVP